MISLAGLFWAVVASLAFGALIAMFFYERLLREASETVRKSSAVVDKANEQIKAGSACIERLMSTVDRLSNRLVEMAKDRP